MPAIPGWVYSSMEIRMMNSGPCFTKGSEFRVMLRSSFLARAVRLESGTLTSYSVSLSELSLLVTS